MRMQLRDGIEQMQCQRQGCEREATHYPEVTIPPKNYPIEQGITLQFGLQLCLYHLNRLTIKDLFNEEGRKKMNQAIQTIHHSEVPLDFTRSRIRPRRIGDSNWKILNKEDS